MLSWINLYWSEGEVSMMQPIPRHLLIHSAEQQYGKSVRDDDGNESWPLSRQLTQIRFEPSKKMITTSSNTEIRLSMIMFYDQVNSRPASVRFKTGDCIVWHNRAFRVVDVEYLYDQNTLHHQEIGLV